MENLKEEFNANFDEEDSEKAGKTTISMEKYDQLKVILYLFNKYTYYKAFYISWPSRYCSADSGIQ